MTGAVKTAALVIATLLRSGLECQKIGDLTMKIPEKVRLNGINYEIQFVHNLNRDGVILDGEINHNYSLINLSSSTQGYQQQCITFLHEICHAILRGYDCTENEKTLIPQNDEELVEMFARGFYQFLQENGAALFDVTPHEGG